LSLVAFCFIEFPFFVFDCLAPFGDLVKKIEAFDITIPGVLDEKIEAEIKHRLARIKVGKQILSEYLHG
jgi:hypothetical protein